jgi:hypothetical protein
MSSQYSAEETRISYDQDVLRRIIASLNGAPILVVSRQSTYVGIPTLHDSSLLLKSIAVEYIGDEHTITHSVVINIADITFAGRAPYNIDPM